MAEHGFRQMLEHVKTIAGYADRANIKPHSIRHAFATRLMENGADIKSIQAALGHADAATTLVYLHAAEQPAKAMANLASLTPPEEVAEAKPARGRAEDIFARRRRTPAT
jgi:site-specific recombinase XerD